MQIMFNEGIMVERSVANSKFQSPLVKSVGHAVFFVYFLFMHIVLIYRKQLMAVAIIAEHS